MGIHKFSVLEAANVKAEDLAKKIGSAVAKSRFNGKSDEVISGLELATLTGDIISRSNGQYQVGFELYSGKLHLGDVYIGTTRKSATVMVDVPGHNIDTAALLQYM